MHEIGAGGVGTFNPTNWAQNFAEQMKTSKTYNKGSSSSGNSGGSSGGSDGSSALLAYLQQMEAQKRQVAQDAYNRNKAAYENAFAERQGLLKNNLDTTLKNLESDYTASKYEVNQNSESAMRDAYINHMNNQKNLAQNLSALGISGGAAETTIAGLGNNYGNARNSIALTTNDNIANLERLYDTNKNSAYQAYNDQIAADALAKANYMTQLENDLASAIAASYTNIIDGLGTLDSSYLSGMSGLINDQQGYTAKQVSASNAGDDVSTSQGSSKEQTRAAGSLAGRAKSLKASGWSDQAIITFLNSLGANAGEINSILQQLG